MKKKQVHLVVDILLIAASIAATVIIIQTGIIYTLSAKLNDLHYFGSFIAGTLFTSVFTTTPAIAILSELSKIDSILSVAFWGGLGAMIGDYIIFIFVRDRIAEDLRFMLRHSKIGRIKKIFHNRLFRWIAPVTGILVIASPLPDEIGITLMGLSSVRRSSFLLLSFIANSIGIIIIGLLANALT